MSEGEHYTPERAAKVLAVEPEEVYEMLESGALEGERVDQPGHASSWKIPERALHGRLPDRPPEQDRRRTAQKDPRVDDLPPEPSSS